MKQVKTLKVVTQAFFVTVDEDGVVEEVPGFAQGTWTAREWPDVVEKLEESRAAFEAEINDPPASE